MKMDIEVMQIQRKGNADFENRFVMLQSDFTFQVKFMGTFQQDIIALRTIDQMDT